MMYDIAIIGAGSGGLTVAAAMAKFGRRVILFERGKMGGDCLNYGCVPSKALIAMAKQAHIRGGGAAAYREAMAHVRQVIAGIAPHDSAERFEALGVTVVPHEARFGGPHKLQAGGAKYEAKCIVIATGSRPALPPVAGLADVAFLTNETIFENDVLPAHLIIMGGGPIGMELAQAHRRLGSQVTVIEAAEPLGREDPELAAVALRVLTDEGVKILAGSKALSVRRNAKGIAVETDRHGSITGSHLLVATGRTANIETLDLAAAGVAATAKGITVDRAMRTSQRHIYAIGDVAGGLQFTHVASLQAGLVVRHALTRLPGRYVAEQVPRVTYCDPEIAAVGLTEAEARARHGYSIKVLRWPYAENDRARTEGRTEGLVKIIAARNGRILGAHMVGVGCGDQLQAWSLAVAKGLKLSAMAQAVLPYPTRGEAGKRAALASYDALPQNRLLRRAIELISKLP